MATKLHGRWLEDGAVDYSKLHLAADPALEADATGGIQVKIKSGGNIVRDVDGLSVPLIQGTTGIQGEAGFQGTTGLIGSTGIQGATGTLGMDGVTGIQGETGLPGTQGIDGVTGLQGPTGFQGQTGIQGDEGPKGDPGYTGLEGPTGFQGVTGSQGETGAQGFTGLLGDTGIQGVTGIQGIGDQGVTGVQGETGIQGQTGIQGGTGAQGGTGIQGVTGLNGETGIQGQTGIQGLVGDTGVQGSTGAGIQGTTGLQGPTGFQGDTGIQGVTGLQGETGALGSTGVQGPTGIQGIQGETGVQGSTGFSAHWDASGVDIYNTNSGNVNVNTLRVSGGNPYANYLLTATDGIGDTTWSAPLWKTDNSTGFYGSTLSTVNDWPLLLGHTWQPSEEPFGASLTVFKRPIDVYSIMIADASSNDMSLGFTDVPSGKNWDFRAHSKDSTWGPSNFIIGEWYYKESDFENYFYNERLTIDFSSNFHVRGDFVSFTPIQGNQATNDETAWDSFFTLSTNRVSINTRARIKGGNPVAGYVLAATNSSGDATWANPTTVAGLQGVTGLRGITGLQGETGIQGATGTLGIDGVTGLQGETGIQGVTGLQGETGIQGATGTLGIDGVTGLQGVTGVGVQGALTVEAKTSVYNLQVSDHAKVFINTDATAEVQFNLPIGAVGVYYYFGINSANNLRVNAPISQIIRVGAQASSVGGFIDSTTVGAALQLLCIDSTNWLALSMSNTWYLN